jgi:hypothetical protein
MYTDARVHPDDSEILNAVMGSLGDLLPLNHKIDLLRTEHVRGLWFGYLDSHHLVNEWLQVRHIS